MSVGADFPVTTPFGQVAGYPLNNGFHNGIDYGFPSGTPVTVNGVDIGISNATGYVIGAHLHVGKYVGGMVQNPGVNNGFSFNSAVVFDTGYDNTNGNYVRIMGDGALWNYLHLKTTLVSKGQVLKAGGMLMVDRNLLFNYYKILFGRAPDPGADVWLGKPADVVFQALQDSAEYKAVVAARATALSNRDNQIAELQKHISDLTKQVNDQATKIADLQGQVAAGGSGGIDQATKDQISETNNIVKQIWVKITNIFK